MLYAEPGTAYVYLSYGMHYCLNAVTEPLDIAGAVLIRALEPLATSSSDIVAPPKQTPNILRTDGPGRLARALGITQELFNGKMLLESSHGLYISAGDAAPPSKIITTTRIGITKATDFLWRFYELENPWVSVRNKAAEIEATKKV
jgi:DNA-3-methyladenine glycosylase